MKESRLWQILQGLESFSILSEGQKAFANISSRYREGRGDFLQTNEEKHAYLFTRMPGTFSAVFQVLKESRDRFHDFSPTSLLDVGAGPGTAMWAALELFPSLAHCTLLEKDREFMELGKKMIRASPQPLDLQIEWKHCFIEEMKEMPLHDLIVLSYSLGEVPEKYLEDLMVVLWKATGNALCIVEPGTPQGYSRLMRARNKLKELGGYLWAPCPHSSPCPLPSGDWCHFSVRVPRSSLHRQLKNADLGYEDEKYSYILFGKNPCSAVPGRIIRHPLHRSGHVEFVVCQEDGIEKRISSRKEKDLYKIRKKLQWGDVWE
ncbi:MAG: rRNA methyltransferase [Chlamydiae bacterium]|nr:rRNA methyltransferase [Chlamydiota bacterium]